MLVGSLKEYYKFVFEIQKKYNVELRDGVALTYMTSSSGRNNFNKVTD